MSSPDVGNAQAQSTHPAAALGQLPRHKPSKERAANSRITTARVVPARQTPASTKDDKNATGAKPLNPCKLVSLSEAQMITGGGISKLIEAPLGPTCIYSRGGRSASITLAVETARFSDVTRHMVAPTHVVVSGHRSVCGRLGTQMLFVPLGRYQVLNVTAPCAIARGFATLALGRLSA